MIWINEEELPVEEGVGQLINVELIYVAIYRSVYIVQWRIIPLKEEPSS